MLHGFVASGYVAAARTRTEDDMTPIARVIRLLAVVPLLAASAWAADYPAPKQGDWVAHDFKFHTGETFAELKLYLIPASPDTLGHLTTGNARFYTQQLRELLDTAPRHAM